MKEITPKYDEVSDISTLIDDRGFCVFDALSVRQMTDCTHAELDDLSQTWGNLPKDQFLKDGGTYRHRRHGSFIYHNDSLTQVPHRAHWQPVDYNALHGGILRLFEPVLEETIVKPAWKKILCQLALIASDLRRNKKIKWCIEAHQFRIDTLGGIGRPTPEGAHRDGVDFVAVFMVKRQDIKGGETRVFESNGPMGERFTLNEPWSLLLLDDSKVTHESTPIQPLEQNGFRDTLVITLRENYFQDPKIATA